MLNAFRHHWNLHVGSFVQPRVLVKTCSTPFGIIGIFTRPTRRARLCQHPCSTPFGIIGIFTHGHGFVQVNRQPVLNAFRHHWNLHRDFPALQPFRMAARCSTPFGIIGIFTRAGRSRARSRSSSCSTPFGIIGIFTCRASSCKSTPSCAQRLSASLESSHLRRERLRSRLLCSTPFGIIGIFTAGLPWSKLPSRGSAQRLSASLESSPGLLKFPAWRRNEVLNAFRHHWNLHYLGATRAGLKLNVLNAFRHHWNLHVHRWFASRGVQPSAQRLSASLESSRQRAPSASVRL